MFITLIEFGDSNLQIGFEINSKGKELKGGIVN